MALYFNSETFGQICCPQVSYKWFVDGFNQTYPTLEKLIRSDVPFQDISKFCPYDLFNGAEYGAYIELFTGVTFDGGGSSDIGLIKVTDNTFGVYNVQTGQIPTTAASAELPFTYSAGAADFTNTRKTEIYFGCMYYDDNTSNYAQLVYFIDAQLQTYDFSFSGATATIRPHYEQTPAGKLFTNCTVTDRQISFIQLPDILPSVREFTASQITNSQYSNVFLNADITTANGGAGFGVPVNFQGDNSQPDYGNGIWDDYSDSRGNADPASDTILQSGLIAIYNPDAGDLHQLGSFLHSTDLSDVINKMWDNPNESIISLALFPIAPDDTSPANIVLGGIDTEIASVKLNSHARKVSFGTIDLQSIGEKFGSFLDYAPHTTAVIYLPYIGQHELRINDIQNTKIKLDYTIDFLNGDICAQIQTTDKVTKTIETLHGNCAAQIPLTSSNYSQIYQSLISMVGNITAGNTLGALNDVMGQKVSHSTIGGIGATVGMHGRLDAFLLINRPNQVLPQHYNEIKGRPLQVGGTVSQFHGHTIGKIECQIPTATEREKDEIEQLFENGGVYLV